MSHRGSWHQRSHRGVLFVTWGTEEALPTRRTRYTDAFAVSPQGAKTTRFVWYLFTNKLNPSLSFPASPLARSNKLHPGLSTCRQATKQTSTTRNRHNLSTFTTRLRADHSRGPSLWVFVSVTAAPLIGRSIISTFAPATGRLGRAPARVRTSVVAFDVVFLSSSPGTRRPVVTIVVVALFSSRPFAASSRGATLSATPAAVIASEVA